MAERTTKVARLQLNVPGDVTFRAQQRMNIVAIPLDYNSDPIHGLETQWESSDKSVLSITPDGQARALRPGKAVLTVSAAYKQEQINATVVEDERSTEYVSKEQARADRIAQGAISLKAHWSNAGRAETKRTRSLRPASARSQQEPPTLPIEEVGSIYESQNAVGTPSNRSIVGASAPPAAIHTGRELPGSDNFSFSLPVASLPGRGLDARLNLHYNSRIWNASNVSGGGTRLTYDVDNGWPAPGFNLGYGRVQKHNNSKYTLIDADGTRHEMRADTSATNFFITTDGTYIRFYGDQWTGLLQYPDGTLVESLGPGVTGNSNFYYPSKITDASGNYILFNYEYQTGTAFRLSSIKDTLGRFVRFHYEGNSNKLITVTLPGYSATQDRQTIRFYYEVMPLVMEGAFQDVIVNAPATARVIRYVYLPGEKTGYRYDYSSYGMIRQITQLREMTVSTNSLTETGMVTGEGQTAAVTTYDYPLTPANLSAAPAYSRRTDDWSGRTAGMNGTMEAPYFTFFTTPATEEEIAFTTITAPDGTETVSNSEGLVETVEIRKRLRPLYNIYMTYKKSRLEWETVGSGSNNRRLKRVQETNEAGQTRTMEYAYTSYNNISQVTERDFNTDATTMGRPLRRAKMQYATDASSPNYLEYINRRLLHLKTRVEVFSVAVDGTEQKMSRLDIGYDESPLVARPNGETDPNAIRMHELWYDPYAPSVEVCEPPELCPHCPPICHWEPQYSPATARRGNVTSIKSYADAAAGTIASHKTYTYDIAGSVVSEGSVSCCQQKVFAYDAAYQYAYPTSETRGSGPQLVNNYSYDYATGLLRTSTDENNQTTILHYYPETLRPYQTARPDGSTTDTIYFNDMLFADPDASRMHNAVMTITSLDAGRTTRSWQFFDGRGSITRTFGDNAGQGHIRARYIEYDEMSRTLRESNPYYAVYGGGSPVNPTGKWTTYKRDPLGRIYHVTLPDGNAVQGANVVATQYAGTVTTFTDPAGKQRRQTKDALGRVVQVDEPDSAGALNQSTVYTYDALDNLIKVTQGEQSRYFKYDSLSRLTHERQVEQDAPHQQADPLTGNNWWSRKNVYNEYGLITDGWDARGVLTHVTYDGLNRVTQVTYSGDTTTITPAATYTYDEARQGYFNNGRLTTITTAAVNGTQTDVPQTSQAYDYDRLERVTRQRQTIGANTYTISYGYNLAGQLTSETYPSGRAVQMGYDVAARLQGITDGSTGQALAGNFSYGGHGGLESETWGNGATHTMTYNDRLQVSQIKLTAGGVERQRFDYSYGEINVDTAALDTTKNTGQVASIDGWIDGTKQWQQRFAYDKLGRLSTGKELTNMQGGPQAWRVDYTYDRYGNRYQGEGQGSIPVASNEIDRTRNRFLSPYYDPNNSTSPLIVYDAAGNVTIDRKFNVRQYTYDANGRMRRADASTQYALAAYDGLGQRVQHSEFGVNQQSVYDIFGRLVAHYENNAFKRDHVYRDGLLLCTIEANTATRYVLSDHQGSTRAVMEGSQIVERHDYKPFGEEISAGTGLRVAGQGYNAPNPLRRQYAMNERDQSTGLDHTWWRKYEPNSGRWTSPDPYSGSMSVSDPQSFNQFSYVRNDPVNLIDPTGMAYCYIRYTYLYSYREEPDGIDTLVVYVHAEQICIPDGGGSYQGPGPSLLAGVNILPGPTPQPTPEPPVNPQQKGFDDCARGKIKTFRRSEYRAIGKIAVGTVGVMVLGRAVPIAAASANANIQALGMAAPVVGAFTGRMLVTGFMDSGQNHEQLEKGLQECKDMFPQANHSTFGIMVTTY